jgi:hypothetical protein
MRKQTSGVNGVKNLKNCYLRKSVSQNHIDNSVESGLDLMSSGDNPQKALELALRAMKLFEKFDNGKPGLELVMCLHVTAAIYCSWVNTTRRFPCLSVQLRFLIPGKVNSMLLLNLPVA